MAEGRGGAKALGWLIVVVYVGGAVVAGWAERSIESYPPEPWLGTVGLVVAFGWFALLGAIVLARQPRNPMGWLLVAVGLPLVLTAAGNNGVAYLLLERGHEPTLLTSLLAWPNNFSWYLTLGLMFVYVPLLFPTGRLPSPRWRIVAWGAAVGTGGMCVLGAIATDIGLQVSSSDGGSRETIPNPIGVPGLAHVEQLPVMAVFGGVFVVSVVAAFVALVVRFRASSGVERRQMTWLVLAAALVPPTIGLEVALDALGIDRVPAAQGVGFVVAVNAIPLAIGLAVLRYRLYDIDRVVSRTVSYLVLSILLLGIYVGGVVGLGGLVRSISGGGDTDLVVAASTLAVAAAFHPLRHRIQRLVDRRFSRTRYDAAQVVAAFSQRLRDEVDLDALAQQLGETVTAAVHPRQVLVWLAAPSPLVRP